MKHSWTLLKRVHSPEYFKSVSHSPRYFFSWWASAHKWLPTCACKVHSQLLFIHVLMPKILAYRQFIGSSPTVYYNVVYEEIHLNTICQIQEKTKVIIMTIVNKSQYKFRLVNKLVEILSSQQGLITILLVSAKEKWGTQLCHLSLILKIQHRGYIAKHALFTIKSYIVRTNSKSLISKVCVLNFVEKCSISFIKSFFLNLLNFQRLVAKI